MDHCSPQHGFVHAFFSLFAFGMDKTSLFAVVGKEMAKNVHAKRSKKEN